MRENSVPAYDEQTGRGLVRHIMTRSTTSGELMVVVVVTRADIPKARSADRAAARLAVPGLCSVCLSVNSRRTNVILGTDIRVLWGKAAMEDTLCGLRFCRFAALLLPSESPTDRETTTASRWNTPA